MPREDAAAQDPWQPLSGDRATAYEGWLRDDGRELEMYVRAGLSVPDVEPARLDPTMALWVATLFLADKAQTALLDGFGRAMVHGWNAGRP